MEIRAAMLSPTQTATGWPAEPASTAAGATSTQAGAASAQAAAKPASGTAVKEALDKVNGLVEEISSSLHFEYASDTKQLVVKIIDTDTGKTIRQYPAQEFLDIMESISSYIGMILDKKA